MRRNLFAGQKQDRITSKNQMQKIGENDILSQYEQLCIGKVWIISQKWKKKNNTDQVCGWKVIGHAIQPAKVPLVFVHKIAQ